MITSSPPEILCAHMVSVLGLNVVRPSGLTGTKWGCSRGAMPNEWDRWVAVQELAPFTEGKIMGCHFDPDYVGESVVKPVVQVLVRALDYSDASEQARRISCALSPVALELVTTDTDEEVMLHACCIEMQPRFLMQEEKGRRQVFVMAVKLSISGVS